uniref:Ribosomal protein L16 n=1 Tax=Renouxia sp. TaxID=2485823 RepID=A0A3G3MID6_9FLOR|nr:ribosomal protein L16 [Renouxia sp.]
MIKKLHNSYPLSLTYSKHVLKFGIIGFKAMSSECLTKEQLDSVTWILKKKLKSLINNKTPKVWSLILLNRTLTCLSAESRMGKGKGTVYTQAFFVKPGFILFEFSNISKSQALEILKFIKKRIPIKMSLICKVTL